ncbi:MAG: hypothetical protein RMM51_12000 [Verrucomicrobiae bacterium]|nr:hypothetical protein [Verrucomicrobiae bacterium]
MSAAVSPRREVHEMLLAVLAERYRDDVRVVETIDAEDGEVVYAVSLGPFVARVGATRVTEEAAGVSVHVRLGRCYRGYRRALRWLSCNRAGNTVGVEVSEEEMEARELCVGSNRITFPGDTNGVRAQFEDLEAECGRLKEGMAWFPQMASGERISVLESAKLEPFDALLVHPRGFLEWARENRAAARNWGPMPAEVCGWLGYWNEALAWLDEHYRSLPSEEQGETRPRYLRERIKILGALNRYAEVLRVTDELEAVAGKEAADLVIVARLRALCGLGRGEEASELAKSAQYDRLTRVWYWRSVALALQQRWEESVEHYRVYEALLGPDILGRQKMRELFPDNWGSNDQEDLA